MTWVQDHGLSQHAFRLCIMAQRSFDHSIEIQCFELMRMALEVFGNQGVGFIEPHQRRQHFYIRQAGHIVRRVKAKRFSILLGCLRETLLLAVSDSEIQV
jgi:hypothetical protein